MNQQTFRIAVAAAVVWYALGTPGLNTPGIGPAAPYSGPMSAVHQAASSAASADRSALSQAFEAGADMLAADSRDLVGTTDKAQDYVLAILTWGYNGIGKPAQKYPQLADAIEAELTKIYGTEQKALTPSEKAAIVSALRELSKAVL
ncbi:MAG: hypothetical protein ACO3NZ_14520 [Pirellulales bacterium]